MEAYFAVKSRLFDSEISDRGVINIGDPWGERLHRSAGLTTTTVSTIGSADVSATDLGATAEGTSFRVTGPEGFADVSLPLVGDFNVSNALVAFGMALELGVEITDIATGLSNVRAIRGRMEVVAHDGPFTVIVDYAHTPDAIAAVLGALRGLTQARLITVIGAGGDRDSAKRSIMGAIAARMSDVTLITTDNPRNEDPQAIADEIHRGASAQPNADVEIIIDRKAAIRRSITVAEAGDIVVVLGKGHEQGQELAGVTVPFDDREEVREALRLMNWNPR